MRDRSCPRPLDRIEKPRRPACFFFSLWPRRFARFCSSTPRSQCAAARLASETPSPPSIWPPALWIVWEMTLAAGAIMLTAAPLVLANWFGDRVACDMNRSVIASEAKQSRNLGVSWIASLLAMTAHGSTQSHLSIIGSAAEPRRPTAVNPP